MFRELVASAVLVAGFIHASDADAFPRAYRLAAATGLQASADPSGVTLDFGAEGRVSGSAGCNRIMGTYRRDGGRVTLAQVATTKMLCAPERMAVEAAVLAALAKPGTIIGDTVTFTDGAGTTLRFE